MFKYYKQSLLVVSLFSSICFSNTYSGKKILFVDSYHEGYAWSDGITEAIKKVVSTSGATLEIFRMDTKRNPDETSKKNAGIKAKEKIDSYKPDILIISDDNAAKYLAEPYYKNTPLPVVFCGINWDASIYGFPCSNVTGILEVSPANILIDYLKKNASGSKIGIIGPDNETYLKEVENINKNLNLSLVSLPVKTMDEWEKGYIDFQKSVDMLIVENNAGITNWDDQRAKQIVLQNTRIPTGTMLEFMAPFALICFTRTAQEQGEWAAAAALKILDGKIPSEIPVDKNKRGDLILNLIIAGKTSITFDLNLVKIAKQIIK
ncbi:MAG: hypothetical protein GX640_21885 [Fibrobacter sp.]|nr:hypothetical protein [Fibrobacter sp.]